MAKFKGFGSLVSPERTQKKRKNYDPSFSLRFEKYVTKHLGQGWGDGVNFNNFDDRVHRILVLEVPREKHDLFTEEYQLKIKKLGQKFGVDYLEIKLVNLSEAVLRQRVTSNRPVLRIG